MNYNKLYNDIIENRKENIPTGYTEEHHITPRCLGGTDDKDNLVKLTAKEHFICHLLLTKMYTYGTIEYYKMCHAFLMMLKGSNNQQRYITSRKYEKMKIVFSKRMSVLQSGKNNSQHGTMWIHNKELQQCKKVPKDSKLETGWELGRVLNWNKKTSVKKTSVKKEPKNYVKICNNCNATFDTFSKNKTCCSYECGKNLSAGEAAKKCRKKVLINDIIYDSLHDAAIALGITPEGVTYRIKNGIQGSFI